MADKLNLPGANTTRLPESRADAKDAGKPQDNGSKPSDAATLTPPQAARVADDRPAEVPANQTDAKAVPDKNVVGGKTLNPTATRVVGESASLHRAVDLDIVEQDDGGLSRTLAEIHAADSGAGISDKGGTLYSSHPIDNLSFGPFRFEKTLLRLDAEDAERFEAMLKKLPPMERNRIQKIDEGAAAEIVKQRLETRATKEFDSGVGLDRLSRLREVGPTVGVGKLEAFANTAHTDMNHPIGAADEVAAAMEAQADESNGDESSNVQGGNANNA